MCTAKEAAHVLSSARKTEVLTVMTVFIGIAGRDLSFELSLNNIKTNPALYQRRFKACP